MLSGKILSSALLAFLTLAATQLAFAAAPTAPSGCIAYTYNRVTSPSPGSATIKILWTDNSNNETQWKIRVSLNNGSFSDLGTISSSTTAQTGITTFTNYTAASLNTAYRFRVIAINSSGSSTESNIASVGTYDLGAPVNLSVTAVDPFNVVMSWQENSTSETGFTLERKTGSGAWQYIDALPPNTVALLPSKLIQPMLSYSFRIRAYKGAVPSTPDSPAGADVSAYTNVATITSGAYTLNATAPPGQPTINLSWPDTVNESSYEILVLLPGSFTYEQLDVTAANVTAYQITNPTIESGKSYSFIVRPYVGSSAIGESNVASVLTDGITSKTGTSGTPGAAFSHTFTIATSGSVTSRSLTGTPSGLTFNSSTGALTGVYPAIGNYTLNYTSNLSNGGVLNQTFHIRARTPAGPPVAGTAIPAWTAVAGTTRDTPLAGTFNDPEAESAVRVSTTLGNMDFILFNTATPATVTNFMNYVNAGKYTDVVFHRSKPNFVIQGGGFKGAGTGSNFTSVVTSPPVANEPGIANTRGTISLAKVGGNPNSATSQFFVNVQNNTANLDYQNGGFTVFGRVAGNGMTIADAINALPTLTYNLFLDGSASPVSFEDFPMNAASAPISMDQTKLMKVNSVTTIPTLSHGITGNTNPSAASASIVSGQLRLVSLAGGQTTVTLTATDLDGLTATQTVPVTVNDSYTTWVSRNTFPGSQSGISQNPDGDALNNLQEYAFLADPSASSPGALPAQGKTGSGPEYLTLTFPVRKFTTGLSYVVEANNSLSGTWTTVWASANGFVHSQVVSAADQADRTVVTIKDTAAIGGSTTRFLRTRVVQN
jgi:cyclophilin family peptidyl-prolyl cis-trans isomerase